MTLAFSRRASLAAIPALVFAGPASARVAPALPIDKDAPSDGPANGDLTIFSFFDYNCPYCKKAEPALQKVVAQDGRIRLVYAHWPMLAKSSVTGALLALAANRQGAHRAAHAALMAIPGGRVPDDKMVAAVRGVAGLNLDRLQADLDRSTPAMLDHVKRNAAMARRLGLQGTPTYVIGRGVAGTLDEDGFRNAIALARSKG